MIPRAARSTAEEQQNSGATHPWGGDGEDWESLSSTERYMATKEGGIKHVLVTPSELYEMLMGAKKEQKQG